MNGQKNLNRSQQQPQAKKKQQRHNSNKPNVVDDKMNETKSKIKTVESNENKLAHNRMCVRYIQ